MSDARIEVRPAVVADLPAVLALYGQPEMDDGAVLSLGDAERLLADLARAGLGDRAILHVRHRPNDATPTRVLVRARLGLPALAMLLARAIHLQDQPDRVFQPDLADFFARLGAPPL